MRFDFLKTMEILLTWIEAVEVREFTASLNLQNPSHLMGSDRHLTMSQAESEHSHLHLSLPVGTVSGTSHHGGTSQNLDSETGF